MQKVKSVSKSLTHTFSKEVVEQINLIEGLGVEDDAHLGKTVKHRYLARKYPANVSLRQVHLIHHELIKELNEKGFNVSDGSLGENIKTMGIDLLNLPTDTLLKIGNEAIIKITGLRNPCVQLDLFQKGLLKAVIDKDDNGHVIRKCGIMAIVIKSGIVNTNDTIEIFFPQKPFKKLVCV